MAPIGPPSRVPPAGTPSPGGLPERMKANKAIAGKSCPACAEEIRLGSDAWNCPACATPHHAACRDRDGGCMQEGCSSRKQPAAGQETKPCPYCGEPVLKAAKKCKHCREILSPALRAARASQAKGDLNAGRTALICGLVGIVVCQPILGPAAIIKGVEARKKEVQVGMGTAGIVLGIVDLLVFLLYLLTMAGR